MLYEARIMVALKPDKDTRKCKDGLVIEEILW
jgi:hypothetical protein